MIPKNTVWTGHEYAPCDFYAKESPALMECVTTGNTPYHFNLHVADVGHTLVVGPTGAGKSTFLATIVAQALGIKTPQYLYLIRVCLCLHFARH